MPTITGTLSDIGLAALTPYSPRLSFAPSSPAVDEDGRVFATRPVEVTPNANGQFSVTLATTIFTTPRIHYVLSVYWMERAAWDVLPLRIEVGETNSPIGDTIDRAPGDLVYVGTDVPVQGRREQFQFNPVTGDLYGRQD